MAGDVELNELEAKRKALAAEAEVYRQTLKLEIQNLRLCAAKAKRTATSLSFSNPAVMLGAVVAGKLLKGRSFFRLRLVTTAIVAWQLYQKLFMPLKSLFSRRASRSTHRIHGNAEQASVRSI
jgi:hypothetical protein